MTMQWLGEKSDFDRRRAAHLAKMERADPTQCEGFLKLHKSVYVLCKKIDSGNKFLASALNGIYTAVWMFTCQILSVSHSKQDGDELFRNMVLNELYEALGIKDECVEEDSCVKDVESDPALKNTYTEVYKVARSLY